MDTPFSHIDPLKGQCEIEKNKRSEEPEYKTVEIDILKQLLSMKSTVLLGVLCFRAITQFKITYKQINTFRLEYPDSYRQKFMFWLNTNASAPVNPRMWGRIKFVRWILFLLGPTKRKVNHGDRRRNSLHVAYHRLESFGNDRMEEVLNHLRNGHTERATKGLTDSIKFYLDAIETRWDEHHRVKDGSSKDTKHQSGIVFLEGRIFIARGIKVDIERGLNTFLPDNPPPSPSKSRSRSSSLDSYGFYKLRR